MAWYFDSLETMTLAIKFFIAAKLYKKQTPPSDVELIRSSRIYRDPEQPVL